MSLFPTQLDTLAPLPDPSVQTPARAVQTAAQVPALLLGEIFDSLAALEAHLGFSLATGGDVRPDNTGPLPGPGRTVLPLTGHYTVTQAQAGLTGFFVPLAHVLPEARIPFCHPSPALSADLPATSNGAKVSALLRSQNAVLLSAVRASAPSSPVAVSALASGAQSLLAFVLTATGDAFVAGEVLTVNGTFWGGL